MTCYDEQIEQAEADLGKLLEEEKTLKSTLNACRETVAKCESRLHALRSYFSGGEIQRAEKWVEDLKLEKHLSKCRRIAWKVNRYYTEADYVVTRVTPKRIYFSRVNGFREHFVDRITGKEGKGDYCNVMDIEATFPEGVENYRGHD